MNTATLSHPPATCAQLRARLRRENGRSEKLRFEGVGEDDVYNITAPFSFDGRVLIAGRVEARSVEHAKIMFFEESDGVWEKAEGAPVFDGLQDPCVTFIDGELIIGGVNFPVKMSDGGTGWRMDFYRGKTLETLRHFFSGPDRMKDIRFAALADGRTGVFTRPQGEKGGRGKIGFCIADSLDKLNAADLEAAPLLAAQCIDDEWVGANEAHLLPDGSLGVLGHIANFDATGNRHYYAMAFRLDPKTGEATAPEMIAERSFFPEGATKRPDLSDVIFSGGLSRRGDGTAVLYAGLSDCEAGCAEIPDPFAK